MHRSRPCVCVGDATHEDSARVVKRYMWVGMIFRTLTGDGLETASYVAT